jgi:histidinol-phosphate phosphatase family protein
VKQAVILAGGKGTRLKERLGDLPKPLIDVDGRPLLWRQLKKLEEFGFEEAVVLVNYRADRIESFLASSGLKLRTRVVDDGDPRGTAGAVLTMAHTLEECFLVVYGDTLFDVDLDRFEGFHRRNAGAVTLFLHPNDHPEDSDLVEVDEDRRVIDFHAYPHPAGSWFPNLVNAALYFVEKKGLLPYRGLPPPLDFAKDLFPKMLADGQIIAGYVSSEYIKDLGTPARLDKAVSALQRGLVERSSYRFPQRAVFIDRDGTLNEERGHIRRPEDLEVFPFVGAALKRLNEGEYRAVLVTNQPVVARGEASAADLRRVHARLDAEAARSQAFFDAQYVCPHHPDAGYAGEVAALKVDCECRKPKPGLILRAIADMNIDPRRSWFVGDSTADFGAAEAAGVRSIGVRTGQAGMDAKYPFTPFLWVADFAEAVDWILGRKEEETE